jgi:hypothetical protein
MTLALMADTVKAEVWMDAPERRHNGDKIA